MAAAGEEAERRVEWEEEEEKMKGKRGKGRRYGLVEYRALPGYLRDNEYILRHYRCEWPLPQVLLSAFSIHNETLNVWTGSYPLRCVGPPVQDARARAPRRRLEAVKT